MAITVRKVTQVDEELVTFFAAAQCDPPYNGPPLGDEHLQPPSAESIEQARATIESHLERVRLEGRLTERQVEGVALGRIEVEPVDIDSVMTSGSVMLEPKEFVGDVQVEESYISYPQRLQQAIDAGHTTMFAARDDEKILATVMVLSKDSPFYKPIDGCTKSMHAMHALKKPLGAELPSCPIGESTNAIQIESLQTDRRLMRYGMVPELMKRFRIALEEEIIGRKPDVVFAFTENKALPPMLEMLAPKLSAKLAGAPSNAHLLNYADDERAETLGLTIVSCNPAYDLSFLEPFSVKKERVRD